MKEYLNVCEKKYLGNLLKIYPNKLIDEQYYEMGAYRAYSIGNILIRIVNDKGIVTLEMKSKYDGKKEYFEVSEYAEYLGIDYRYEKKGIMQLNLEQQKTIIEDNWKRIQNASGIIRHRLVYRKLNKIRAEKSGIMFPGMK